MREDVEEIAVGFHVFRGELNDRTRLQSARGADVMADSGGHGAEGLAIVIVIGIDDGDWHLSAHAGDEAPHFRDLVGAQGELVVDLRSHGPVGVIPGVMNAHVDEFLQPLAAEQIINVGLAEARGHAGQQFGIEAVLQATQGAVEHVFIAAPLVTDGAVAFHTDQRCGIAEFAQRVGRFLGDELTVGENLKVAVRMHGQKVEQLRVHEGFPAKHAKEGVAVAFGVIHDLVQIVEFDRLAWLVHIHPAALAAEVAGVQNGNVEEGREEFALLHTLFEKQHGARAFEAKIPADFRQAKRIDSAQDARGEGKNHGVGESGTTERSSKRMPSE